MTNLQSLSVFVTERLTLAAQEIFKAVEVTVTEYHEEISRSRQENELLKRRLLEAGIDFYSELQPSLSDLQESEAGIGPPVCEEPWNQQSEKIQVKLELSAAQEDTRDPQAQIVMTTESISPKPCLQSEQKMEDLFRAQATDSSMDTLLPAASFMQIKEEPGELVPDLRLETFCDTQTSISADPSAAVPSSHCSGFEDELDGHRLASVHKAVRSKTNTKTFYGARPRTALAVIPENPQDSDVDLSDDDGDDQIEEPEYLPTQVEESMDEEEVASPSSSSKPPPRKKKKKWKNCLKIVSLDEPEDPTSPPGLHKGRENIWNREDIEAFQVPDSRFEPPDALKTPFQYFRTLFTDRMIEHIAQQTNLYSAQELGDPIETSPQEIEEFLAILLFMGVFSFPSVEDYWHHDSRFSAVADIMPRRRFRLIRRFLHFNDNQQWNDSPDRFFKIRPLFEMLREQCLLIPSTHKHSVDEVVVAYKGAGAGRYVANKPDKRGFKLFCRASSSGIIHDLLLYQGASTFFNVDLSEREQELPLGAKLVTTLCKTIAQPWLSVVFCDSCFTSFKLIQNLHANLGVKCVGTVRSNRGVPLITDQQLRKKGRGAFDYRSSEGVIAVKWLDNKCVNLLSNACGITPLSTVKRWSRIQQAEVDVPCPSLVQAYNEHMGGIDLSDGLVHMYKTPVKSRRWYFPLFGYILDLCISNSWLLYKRDCELLREKPMPLKRFRLAVAQTLKQVNKMASEVGRPACSSPTLTFRRKRYIQRPSQPQPDVRYDNCGHMPLHSVKRGRCTMCPKGVSRWKCEKCDVFLCLNANQECFAAYHKKLTGPNDGQPHR